MGIKRGLEARARTTDELEGMGQHCRANKPLGKAKQDRGPKKMIVKKRRRSERLLDVKL